MLSEDTAKYLNTLLLAAHRRQLPAPVLLLDLLCEALRLDTAGQPLTPEQDDAYWSLMTCEFDGAPKGADDA